MKFSCNNCNTKYSLPDEKFAGKVITLTCKKCGSKIVVKPEKKVEGDRVEKAQEESRPLSTRPGTPENKVAKSAPKKESAEKPVSDLKKTRDIDGPRTETTEKSQKKEDVVGSAPKVLEKKVEKRESKADTDSVEPLKGDDESSTAYADSGKKLQESQDEQEKTGWYYSRGGQQKGPFSDDEIRELVENNVITAKTFIWKDGMMDWMKAGTCVEFKHFFGEGDATGQEKKGKNAIESLGLDELDKKFEKKNKPEKPEHTDKADVSEKEDQGLQDDFFNKEIEKVEEQPATPDEDWTKLPSNEEAEAPRENTRIVIMKAGLSESAKRKRMLTRIVMAGVLIGVFIFVFIRNLGPILSAVGVQMKSGIDLEMEDLDKDTLSKMTPEEREKYRKALLGIKESKKLTKEQKNKIALAIKQKKDSDMASILENAKVEGGAVIYENLGKDRLGSAGSAGVDLNLDSKLANLGINTKVEGVNLSGKVERQDLDLSSKLPDSVDKLNEDMMMAIVNRNRGSLKYCYERHLKASSSLEGKATFRITIQNTGVVSRVESLSKQIAGTMFEECVIKEIKKWVFPKFKGEPIVFEVPFVLTTTN